MDEMWKDFPTANPQPLSLPAETSESGRSNCLVKLCRTCCIHGKPCELYTSLETEHVELEEKPSFSGEPGRAMRKLRKPFIMQKRTNLREYYIGIRSKWSAERETSQKATFKLYHQAPEYSRLAYLTTSLTLQICYRTSEGHCCHFPIVECLPTNTDKKKAVTLYCVDYGDSSPPTFSTLAQLVDYYNIYQQVRKNKRGRLLFDTFPWWRKKMTSVTEK